MGVNTFIPGGAIRCGNANVRGGRVPITNLKTKTNFDISY